MKKLKKIKLGSISKKYADKKDNGQTEKITPSKDGVKNNSKSQTKKKPNITLTISEKLNYSDRF